MRKIGNIAAGVGVFFFAALAGFLLSLPFWY
jgi:hypothetical protein